MKSDIFLAKLLKIVIGMSLAVTAVCVAEEETQLKEEDHVQVTRPISEEEWEEIQEAKYELIQKFEDGEELTEEEQTKLSREISEKERQNLDEKMTPSAKVNKNLAGNYYAHGGVYHRMASISILKESIAIEDGSLWMIYPKDQYKTSNWLTGDTLVLLPNSHSAYKYYIKNLNTNTKIRVDLHPQYGPLRNGINTHWVVDIDYFFGHVTLEDGSIWSISGSDSMLFQKWKRFDTIILGINDGLLSPFNPYILINVNIYKHVESSLIR